MAVVQVLGVEPAAEAALILAPKDGGYVELPREKKAADVIIRFGQRPGHLAFWIESAQDQGHRGPLNCLDAVPSEDYALRNIPEGSYRVHAAIWEASAGASGQPKAANELEVGGPFITREKATVSFTVRLFEDFNASYEWAVVELWHRLPPGLEISLDLGGANGDRRARIPQPWQWDVTVDGADVKRVAVEADDSMDTILARLGISTATHEVVWRQPDGNFERILEPAWTARQADLFKYGRNMFVRSKLISSNS